MKNQTFEVGEIAVLRNATRLPRYNGEECTITHPLSMYKSTLDGRIEVGYLITVRGRTRLLVKPHQLRKKFPPSVPSGETRILRMFDSSKTKIHA